jgi:hypothetical protein
MLNYVTLRIGKSHICRSGEIPEPNAKSRIIQMLIGRFHCRHNPRNPLEMVIGVPWRKTWFR